MTPQTVLERIKTMAYKIIAFLCLIVSIAAGTYGVEVYFEMRSANRRLSDVEAAVNVVSYKPDDNPVLYKCQPRHELRLPPPHHEHSGFSGIVDNIQFNIYSYESNLPLVPLYKWGGEPVTSYYFDSPAFAAHLPNKTSTKSKVGWNPGAGWERTNPAEELTELKNKGAKIIQDISGSQIVLTGWLLLCAVSVAMCILLRKHF